MFNVNQAIWLGTEQSLDAALAAQEMAVSKVKAGFSPASTDEPPSLLQVHGSVGVVNVSGPLFNSPMAEYFGLTTYNGIRKAMVAAANDPAVEHILLCVDSGGGAVSGVVETSNLIATVNAKVKPVTAFAADAMMSAAYWLGSAAGKVYAGQTAQVGSIGVIQAHQEYSKQMAAEGVTTTVMRAGKYKALGNPMEPLSAAGKAEIQTQLDAVYAIFLGDVATHRGMTTAEADKMAQGRVYLGAAAHDVGLVDGITTLSAVLGGLQAPKK